MLPLCKKTKKKTDTTPRRSPPSMTQKHVNSNVRDCQHSFFKLLFWYKHLVASVVVNVPRFTCKTENVPAFGPWRVFISDPASEENNNTIMYFLT